MTSTSESAQFYDQAFVMRKRIHHLTEGRAVVVRCGPNHVKFYMVRPIQKPAADPIDRLLQQGAPTFVAPSLITLQSFNAYPEFKQVRIFGTEAEAEIHINELRRRKLRGTQNKT